MDTKSVDAIDFGGRQLRQTSLGARMGVDLLFGLFLLVLAQVFVGILVFSGGVLLVGVPLQLLGLATVDQVAEYAGFIVVVVPIVGMGVYYVARECIAALGTTIQVLPEALVAIRHEGIREQTETIVRIGEERCQSSYSLFLDEQNFLARNIALRMPRSANWRAWLIWFRVFGPNDTFILR